MKTIIALLMLAILALPAYALDTNISIRADAEADETNVKAETDTQVSANDMVEARTDGRASAGVPMTLPVGRLILEDDGELRMGIKPQLQRAPIGEEVVYTLVVHDSARVCTPCNLDILVEGNVDAYHRESIQVNTGQRVETDIIVKSDNEGTQRFVVHVGEQQTTGAIQVMDSTTVETGAFFTGKGHAVSTDGSLGLLLSTALLRDGEEVKGRMNIENRNFAVSGTTSENNIRLNLEGVNTDVSGSVNAELTRYNTFILLEGTMEIDGNVYEVSMISAQGMAVKEVEVNQRARVMMDEVIGVRGQAVAETARADGSVSQTVRQDIYVRPLDIERRSFLGIPFGARHLVVEVSDGEMTTQHKIRANQQARIDGYLLKVGDLDSETEVEVELQQE